MAKRHIEFLTALITDKKNKGKFTRRELQEMAEHECKYPVSYDIVRRILKKAKAPPDFCVPDPVRNQYHFSIRPSQQTKVHIEPAKRFKMNLKKRNPQNILVIGDLHEPFCLYNYVEFCQEVYEQYECTHTIFIGDIIDNHFTSFHDTDPDGMSALDELARATTRIEKWVKAFPQADVCIGNHDRLVTRKAFASGISALWLRDYNEVLNAPGWNFQEEFIYDGVKYVHGEQGTARNRAKKDLISTVQGHRHPEAYTEHIVGQTFHIFGMQVGCGVDHKAYAMAYAKAGPKPAIGCGVVLDNGQLPINILADL